MNKIYEDITDININNLIIERNELVKEIERLNNIIEELEKDIQKEIDRTNELILEDASLIEITTIRKMLNDERRLILLKINKLKEGK